MEKVNHPEHYRYGTYEAIKVIEAWDLGFCLGNVVKYISRAGRKSGSSELEDLKKAAWYLNRVIADIEDRVAEVERQANLKKLIKLPYQDTDIHKTEEKPKL